ncbi:30S ribosomal protein S1 [Clostridium sp. MSJ-4]|uniref:30S ribosomal protein S1 n=1 Tax=Clostridium simiarum TaxID=2841506 RepID=A0ABS6EXG0_9CLOT|nr:30S ribosomal protein S1 [Clostridium simiarum]MBU5590405.1 30S ribosomal protein S1 [Clostridium simiarum]
MEDNIKDVEMSMEQLLKESYDFKKIHKGDILQGKIIKVTKDEIFVNINYISDGIIPRLEALDNDEEDLRDLFSEGQNLDCMVIDLNDGEGNVLLSKNKAEAIKVWDEFEDSFKNGTLMVVKIKEEVRGGLIANVKGVRVFLPASQVSLRSSTNLKDFIGKQMEVKVIELDRSKGNVVISRKAIELKIEEKKKEALWKEIKLGEKRKGEVVRLTNFGAFVDIGGIQGLVHISDLSWKRILDPKEVVSIGDRVEVYVVNFDKEKNRLSLALKNVDENPWNSIKNKYNVNDVVEGRVSNITSFGAFVELEPGIEGLVPLGEIKEERVVKASDVLTIGDEVKVKILDMKINDKRITLSIKDAFESGVDYSEFNDNQEEVTLADLLGDKLKNLKLD